VGEIILTKHRGSISAGSSIQPMPSAKVLHPHGARLNARRPSSHHRSSNSGKNR